MSEVASAAIMRRMRIAVAVMATLALGGCGPAGPTVRVASSFDGWVPESVMVLPASVASKAILAVQKLPEGVAAAPTTSEAAADTVRELLSAIRDRGVSVVGSYSGAFSRTRTAFLGEKMVRQYASARAIDPDIARRLGEELIASEISVGTDHRIDSVLVTMLLRYGPEMDGNPQTVNQSVATKIGDSDLAISSATTRSFVRFNAHIRCALVRLSDGAVVWDASIRRRKKRVLLRRTTQESVLRDAITALVGAFPYGQLKKAVMGEGEAVGGNGSSASPLEVGR